MNPLFIFKNRRESRKQKELRSIPTTSFFCHECDTLVYAYNDKNTGYTVLEDKNGILKKHKCTSIGPSYGKFE